MTTPKVRTMSRGGVRYYLDPVTGDRVPGVTSIIGQLPKPFLRFWAAKVVAETAVDKLGAVVDLAVKGDRAGAVDFLKRAPGRDTDQAAKKGDEVHALVEDVFKGETPRRVHPEFQPYLDAALAFVDKYQPTFLALEQTVWSETHGYAGSFDWLATMPDDDGEVITVLGDNKTTRSGVHAEVALQLTAYAGADHLIDKDGTRRPMPKVDAGGVLWLRPDTRAYVPVRIDPEFLEVFLALKATLPWDKELSPTALGDPQAF